MQGAAKRSLPNSSHPNNKQMPNYNDAVAALTTAEDCSGKQGVTSGYLGLFSEIASVTEASGTITAITMEASKLLYKVEAEYKPALAEAVYSSDTGTYVATATNIRFTGQDAATTLKIANWVNKCRVVFFPVGVNGIAQAYGLEVVDASNTLKVSSEPGKITRHLNSFGERGNSDAPARNEFDYSAEHDYAPLNVTASILEPLTSA